MKHGAEKVWDQLQQIADSLRRPHG
jgi:hypothetical protein